MTTAELLINTVTIDSSVPFTRYNRYKRRMETVYIIVMSAEGSPSNAPKLVTFTNGRFSDVTPGATVTMSCRHKSNRFYNGQPQTVVTHCKLL